MRTLTAKLRGALPKKAFVVPPKKGEAPSERGGYPIPDRGHAGLAVGLARKYASPAVRAKVEAAVAKKYPDLPSVRKKVKLRGRIASSKRGTAVQAPDISPPSSGGRPY